jgi:hypothetical protein
MPKTVCGNLRVARPFDPSRVSAVCALDTDSVDPGDSVTIGVEITNDNFFPASVSYEITVGDRTIESKQVEVGARTSVSRSVRHQFGFVGSYNVDVSITAQKAPRN